MLQIHGIHNLLLNFLYTGFCGLIKAFLNERRPIMLRYYCLKKTCNLETSHKITNLYQHSKAPLTHDTCTY